MKKNTNISKFDLKLITQMLIDAAKGTEYLHQYDPTIIHRDLKTQNLLVDEFWRVKVCDFGLSRIKASETMSRLGTLHYSAPEVLRGDRYTEKADVYSFGIVMWEMLTFSIPYEGYPPLKIASDVAYHQLRPEIKESFPKPLSTLMQECWDENPDNRPDFCEIVERLNESLLLIDEQTGNNNQPLSTTNWNGKDNSMKG